MNLRLKAMPGGIYSGTVSPDGRKIIVSAGDEKSDVWVMTNFDPQTRRNEQSPAEQGGRGASRSGTLRMNLGCSQVAVSAGLCLALQR